jgi:Protein of unknown function (DUF2971)
MVLPLPKFLRRKLKPTSLASTRTPPVLYHYTSTEGLLGILAHDAVWASDFRYLNDPSEFEFARLQIASGTRTRLSRVRNPYDRSVYAAAIDRFERLDTTAFVSSFSENGNLLSQWRAYAPRDGFSVGFAREALKRVPECTLIRCFYIDEGARRSRNRALLEHFLDEWMNTKPSHLSENRDAIRRGDEHLLEIGREFVARILMNDLVSVALSIKHAAYAEEREWRLVFIPDRPGKDVLPADAVVSGESRGTTLFRKGAFGLTPYNVLKIPRETGKRRSVRELIVGPCHDSPTAVRAAVVFARTHGVDSADVRACGIPYRAW